MEKATDGLALRAIADEVLAAKKKAADEELGRRREEAAKNFEIARVGLINELVEGSITLANNTAQTGGGSVTLTKKYHSQEDREQWRPAFMEAIDNLNGRPGLKAVLRERSLAPRRDCGIGKSFEFSIFLSW